MYRLQCLVAQSCLTLCNAMNYSPPDSSLHGDFLGKNIGVGCHALLQGIESRSLTLQVDSLLSETPGKPKNTVVGSLSLLHGILPTQELNRGLLLFYSTIETHRLRYQTIRAEELFHWFIIDFFSILNIKFILGPLLPL